MKSKIVIDIGSYYTKIYKSKCDIVLYEPTCLVIEDDNYKKVVACGLNAERISGRLQQNMKIIWPVKNSEIIDEKALEIILSIFIDKIRTKFESKPNAILSVQLGIKRSIIKKYENILERIGIYNVEIVENSLLALLGLEAPISTSRCAMLIDMGASQTTICALNLNGVIKGISVDIGGNTLINNIREHLIKTSQTDISTNQIELIRRKLASLDENDFSSVTITGKDIHSGKTKPITILSNNIYNPVKSFVDEIVNLTLKVIKSIPVDALNEISNTGIYLSGGNSIIYGIEYYISKAISLNINTNNQCELSSIIGGGIILDDKKLLSSIKLSIN